MLEIENLRQRPMEVKSDEGYLLIQGREGVAYDPPDPFISTSKCASHFGQTASRHGLPL
jgi:hypothetical protein